MQPKVDESLQIVDESHLWLTKERKRKISPPGHAADSIAWRVLNTGLGFNNTVI